MSKEVTNVSKLAKLAHIKLDHKLEQSLNADLARIIDMLDQIKAAEVGEIEAMEHSFDAKQRLRADVVTESDVRATMQTLVAETDKAAGLYLVPKVIETE